MARLLTSKPALSVLCSNLCLPLLVLLLAAQVQPGRTQSEPPAGLTTTPTSDLYTDNTTTAEPPRCSRTVKPCKKGMVLPVWEKNPAPSGGEKAGRAIVYFLSLCYFFLGVSIVADRFMSAIEVITSKEREVTIKRPYGEKVTVTVRVWNETVSNLTLMALGSSAPEIMLAIIEIIGNKFEAGELGPGTIVGSAAFNLFVIIAICIYVIPSTEIRRIKHLRVFFVTAATSIFAYIWLYLILAVISEGVIDIWEALVTFAFFPILVVFAYITDKRIFFMKFLRKKYHGKSIRRENLGLNDLGGGSANHDGDVEFHGKAGKYTPTTDDEVPHYTDEIHTLDTNRENFIRILRELKKQHPDADMKTLEQMANYEVLSQKKKSRAFYRIQATRMMVGSGNPLKKSLGKKRSSKTEVKIETAKVDLVTRVFFEADHYAVMENVGTFNITVCREGGDLNNTVYIDYRTVDGTANAGSDFDFAEGTIIMKPGETQKEIPLSIIDDDVFEEDEHFYVKLSNLRVGDADGMFYSWEEGEEPAKLEDPSTATVIILDDDHSGIFQFEHKEVVVAETTGVLHLKVVRSSGARGVVRVPYRSIEGSAKGGGVDYEDVDGEIEFDNDETEKAIEVRIVDDEEYEKDENFYLELLAPRAVKNASSSDDESGIVDTNMSEEEKRVAELGKPVLGEIRRIEVKIKESQEFKNTVDKLLKKANISLVIGTSSWREQFSEAITVSAGDDEEDGEEGDEEGGAPVERSPSCMDYFMHFLSVFWKVLFAFIPPTDILGGWACFTTSILMIAVLTAVIGDLASHFGCTIGLKDTVTAISFVALGTSIPDTFASKVAAVGDRYADASIGNVTGSNAVNVFLGIGIAWTIAAVYHSVNGRPFEVDPGSLAFSVTIFSVFAVIAFCLLLVRRTLSSVHGELGGPMNYKLASTVIFVGLWVCYILLSALESYCYIPGF